MKIDTTTRRRRKTPTDTGETLATAADGERAAGPGEEMSKHEKFGAFLRSMSVRAQAATAMMLFFCAVVYAGHLYVWLAVVVLQTMSFRELVSVRYREYQAQMHMQMPLFRTLQWCWYWAALLLVYGDFLKTISRTHDSAAWLSPYTQWHVPACFSLYCVVFMVSVGTLRQDSVKYQVGQLSWTIVTLLIVVGQMKFVAHNIFSGLFWFFFPAWLVINNDCWAYAWGVAFGGRLINRKFYGLSPKKTWEGFLGAAVSTVVAAYFSASWFANSQWLTCPATRLTLDVHPSLNCDPHDIFKERETIAIPLLGLVLRNVRPIQLHAVVMAVFASVVAPYGGFLASAIKRAYEVKDFDSIIPGHGGVTDRVDCEFIMALFVYVYYKSFILDCDVEWKALYSMAQLLSPEHKTLLLDALTNSLRTDNLQAS